MQGKSSILGLSAAHGHFSQGPTGALVGGQYGGKTVGKLEHSGAARCGEAFLGGAFRAA